MRLRIAAPPTLAELWDDPIYQKYLDRTPRLHANISQTTPWMVVAHRPVTVPGPTWATKRFTTYDEAIDRALLLIEPTSQFDDAACISLRKFFKPPLNFTWDNIRYSWCGRCRRPTLFKKPQPGKIHHALRHAAAIITDPGENLRRCYYCGIRRPTNPTYTQRFST